jgi:hypothetical protein
MLKGYLKSFTPQSFANSNEYLLDPMDDFRTILLLMQLLRVYNLEKVIHFEATTNNCPVMVGS